MDNLQDKNRPVLPDGWHYVEPDDYQIKPFNAIGREWMLISAAANGRNNAMTASWGGLGVMWSVPVAFIVIRQTRFTKTLVDNSQGFALSFLDHQQYQQQLNYLGKTSGSTEDKMAGCGLTVADYQNIPYFTDAHDVIICHKLFRSTYKPEQFLADWIDPKEYPTHNYHDLYIGQVDAILQK